MSLTATFKKIPLTKIFGYGTAAGFAGFALADTFKAVTEINIDAAQSALSNLVAAFGSAGLTKASDTARQNSADQADRRSASRLIMPRRVLIVS